MAVYFIKSARRISARKESCVCVRVSAYPLSHVRFFVTPSTVACQAPLPMEFSKQEYCRWLPFPSSGDLPDPGIKLTSLASPVLAGRFFTTVPPGKPQEGILHNIKSSQKWQSILVALSCNLFTGVTPIPLDTLCWEEASPRSGTHSQEADGTKEWTQEVRDH